jgi:putative transposase
MARPLRICLPGGVYHLIARGNAGEPIFRNDDDRTLFLATLAHIVDRFGWLCHAYCLMDNHYHLVAETPRPNLPLGMRQLNGLYAQRFNRRHGRCGHVFQARYRSILVEKESHLLSVCRYVILNPVRAGICTRPEHYRWSSYRATVGRAPAEAFLFTDWLLGHFGPKRRVAQGRYEQFVAPALTEALEQQVCGERLGTELFLSERYGLDPPLAEVPRVQIEPLRPPLKQILGGGEGSSIALAYRRYGYRLHEIAEALGCHYSTVSRRLRREEVLRECKT